MDCLICCESKPQLYPLADCSHRFCQDCCIAHITEKSSRFVEVLCPESGCGRKMLDDFPFASQLPIEVQQRLQKHRQFMHLQKNPNLRPCSQPNCQGLIDMTKPKKMCNSCSQAYCPKCMKPFHNGGCVLDEHDRMMKSLNNQKCPQCSIWVEKKDGCDYIDCKCGTAFCYKCGAKFQQDPCRKGEIWKNQITLRRAMNKLKIKLPDPLSEKLLKIILLPLRALVLLLFTMVMSVVMMVGIFLFMAILAAASPIIVIVLICEVTTKAYCKLLLFLCMPVLAALMAVMIIIALLAYPLLRGVYHHGIYDGVDWLMTEAATRYLRVAAKILDSQP